MPHVSMWKPCLPWSPRAIPETLTLLKSRRIHRSLSFAAANAADGGGMAVKKVTLSNFWSILEDLRVRVREADFIAVDLEMTGVTSAPWRDSFEFDSSDVRYLKVKDSVEKFAVVQFGLCTFRWDASQGSFVAHPLNFYVFPRQELLVEGPANEFLCQTTSLSFLAKYQFDFNACIHEGISYLSKAQEAEALQKLCSANEDGFISSADSKECVEIPVVGTADIFFIERMKMRFHEWRENVLKYPKDPSLEVNHCGPNVELQMVFFKMRPAVMLNGFTSHRSKLIQLVLRKHFKDLVYVCVSGEICSLQKLVVYVDSDKDRAFLMEEIKEDQLRSGKVKIHSAVGFRHVIDLLISEEKLMAGHNCFLDIAHIYKKFIGPLPLSLEEFALSFNKAFPHIIDTKHLINSNHVIQYLMKKSRKSLSSAFSILCPKIYSASQDSASTHSYVKVDVQADEMGSSCWNSGAKHEAGYDAFMTGCVFAQACIHLGIKFEQGTLLMDLRRNDKLQSYINTLHPSWNSGTVINLSTGSECPDSSYKRKYPKIEFASVVLVWGFSSNLKPKDVEECMCKTFGRASIISVFFLDETAALIQFSKAEHVDDFLVLKDFLEKEDGPILVLHPLAKLLEGGNTRAADYDTYREICSSPTSRILFSDQAEATGIKWKTNIRAAHMEPGELASSIAENSINPSSEKHQIASKNNAEKIIQHEYCCEDVLNYLNSSKLVSSK